MNKIMIQFFHWYHPGNLWNELSEKAEQLSELGFTSVWLPPAVKCALGKDGRGYDVYDLYDLGEFSQQGIVATRYGNREEYIAAISKAHDAGLEVIADIVLNHRMGADEMEDVTARQVQDDDRNVVLRDWFPASALTKFTFPGRQSKYSDFIWDYQCFSGIDVLKEQGKEIHGIFKLKNDYGPDWNDNVSHQLGNYDYLMGADVDFRNPSVVKELKRWIHWYIDSTKIDGLRMDALKHISSEFVKDWIDFIREDIDSDFFIVGEFWKDDAEKIAAYSEKMDDRICAFDVPLHYNFFKASQERENFVLRDILKGSFLETHPRCSVTFVGNHDTQRFQALESTVENWFRPIAYAIILLQETGYPCVFYPDIYGAEYEDKNHDGVQEKVRMPKVECLPALLKARQYFAYGEQINYLDDPNCIAWQRKGDDTHGGCIVLLCNSVVENAKYLDLGPLHAHAEYSDYLGNRKEIIKTDRHGRAKFLVDAQSVSVWVRMN